jgi:hypothetical protein
VSNIERYVDDVSQKRPLNFLMLAAPGAGKSHFIRCIAKRLQSKNVSAITFNMASRQSHEDLIPPLDAARNLKVEDRIPLLFLDEFDSSEENYALLLPLLWDGELNIGQRHLKLGKVIIVLAGSSPSLPVTMDHARSMRVGSVGTNNHSSKLIDLFSRINGGVLSIPPFLDRTSDIDRRADKVCVGVHLLRQRFGTDLRLVPLSLLRFISRTEFRYGVRSIAHLIDLLPHGIRGNGALPPTSSLPLSNPEELKGSSLAYHLIDEDQAFGVSKVWQAVRATKALVTVQSEMFDRLKYRLGFDKEMAGWALARVLQDIPG